MRLSQITLGGFVSSALATNLYVSSYGGNVTSVQLSQLPKGGYSLKETSFTNGSLPSPSFLIKDAYNDVVYCVDEGLGVPNGSIASYKTSPSGELTLIDRHSTIGGPVSQVPYNGGKALVIAHYGGSGISSWTINANGSLTPIQSFLFTMAGPGPNPARQEAPHPHEVIVDPTDSYIAVPDLGADLVRIFSFDPKTSLLTASTPVTVPAGSGPRHGAFLKTETATYFYLISELANTVASYSVSYASTGLSMTQTGVSGTYGNRTTPIGAAAAEAILSPDHRFLLTSSRNATLFSIKNFNANNSTRIPSDTLQTWAIDDVTGKLTFKQLSPSGGFYPRQFSVNKNGTLAAVGLQEDFRVVVVSRNPKTGLFGDFVASIDLPGEITSVIWDE